MEGGAERFSNWDAGGRGGKGNGFLGNEEQFFCLELGSEGGEKKNTVTCFEGRGDWGGIGRNDHR